MSNAGYLQGLCNKYGDFKVAIAYKDKEGNSHWSKHRSVMECWESEEGIQFLERTNNRQILPAEIVLDLDNTPTIQYVHKICDKLEEMQEHYRAYITGSRGYHIHIWNNKMATWDKYKRNKCRQAIINQIKISIDQQKAYEVMIAIEDCPHWKTKMPKKLIRQYPGEHFWDN